MFKVTVLFASIVVGIDCQFSAQCQVPACKRGSLDNFNLCDDTSPAVAEAQCLTQGLKKQHSTKCKTGSIPTSQVPSGSNAANQALNAVNQATGQVGRGRFLADLWGFGGRRKRLSLPGKEWQGIPGTGSACLLPDNIPRSEQIDSLEQFQAFDSGLGSDVECQIRTCYAKQECARQGCPENVQNALLKNDFFSSIVAALENGESAPAKSSTTPTCSCGLQAELQYCNELEQVLRNANCGACQLHFVLQNRQRAVDVCQCFDEVTTEGVQAGVTAAIGKDAVDEALKNQVDKFPCNLNNCVAEGSVQDIDEAFCSQLEA